jgi:hypothetical protein
MAPNCDCGAHPDVDDLCAECALGTKVYEGNAVDDRIRLRAVAARIIARDKKVAPKVVERSDVQKLLDNKRFLAARNSFHKARHVTAKNRVMDWYLEG